MSIIKAPQLQLQQKYLGMSMHVAQFCGYPKKFMFLSQHNMLISFMLLTEILQVPNNWQTIM